MGWVAGWLSLAMPNATTAAAAGVIVPRAHGLAQRVSVSSIIARPRLFPWGPSRLASCSKPGLLAVVASAASFDELNAKKKSNHQASKVRVLSDLGFCDFSRFCFRLGGIGLGYCVRNWCFFYCVLRS